MKVIKYLTLAVAVTNMVSHSSPTNAEIIAVTYSGDVISIDESSGTSHSIGESGFENLNGLTRDPSGRYFAVTEEGTIVEISPETGAGTFVFSIPLPSPAYIVRTIAASASGELYWASGLYIERNLDTLAKYDPETRTVISIGTLQLSGFGTVDGLTGLTFAADGRLLAWDQAEFGLIEIDPNTAQAGFSGIRHFTSRINIETLAYDSSGELFGIGGYNLHGTDNLFEFPASARATSDMMVGPLNIRGMEFVLEEGESLPRLTPVPPREMPPLTVQRERYQPEPVIYNLFLVDCGPCPHCFERPCDPRANPDLDDFLIWDPSRGLAASFSREVLGLEDKDGPVTAAAPLYGWQEQAVFVIALPDADSDIPDVGALIFFDKAGNALTRAYGTQAGNRLGQAIDVWQDEVVVASSERLLRFKRGKLANELAIDQTLNSKQGLRVAFTRDMDGDGRPEIMLGTPYADVGELRMAGQIQIIGSKQGSTLDKQYGRFSGNRLGQHLQPIGHGDVTSGSGT